MPKLHEDKTDYSKLIKYYKRKLVDYEVMREIKTFKSEGKYIKKVALKQSYLFITCKIILIYV